LEARQLEYFEDQLQSAKKRLLDEISRLEETGIGDTMSDSVGELSVYDNHPADLGDELFERSKDTALRDNAHVLLEEIEAALDKIAAGTYGVCEKCGEKIATERLEALPWATHCIDCQRLDEVEDPTPRPLEEDVLAPPFHRTFLDSANFDFVGFDGEDSLQSVMDFGSSDSPQDIPGSKNYGAAFPNSNEYEGIVDRADAIPAAPANTRSRQNEKDAKKQSKENKND
jgi:YteA family regulatory protein